ncbi:MAG: PilZ domain-containing protein [Deltaproteobacteria bacterium]|nr:PilZ domain-containing protein [Deltaproteobacteria bacterium]
MNSNETKDEELAIVRLKYKKGDLIIKEGDYGVSIYKIIEGLVSIFTEADNAVIPLATIGQGAVLGETIFLNDKNMMERRSSSARALEDTLVEVWHPRLLRMEYEQMPPVIRYLADQTLTHIGRMNKLVVKLTDQKIKQREHQREVDPWAAKRRYYRKRVNLPFLCTPLYSSSKSTMKGLIKDISLGGAGLEIRPILSPVFPYRLGEEFLISTTLPNDRNLEFSCRLVSIKEGKSRDTRILGVSFIELSEHSAKNLGFFLMP